MTTWPGVLRRFRRGAMAGLLALMAVACGGTHTDGTGGAEKKELTPRSAERQVDANPQQKLAAVSTLRAPIFRFFNEQTGAHFFTGSATERDLVQSTLSPPFKDEGTAFFAASASTPGLSQVYRFYNLRTGVHFYTISESEKASIEATLPDVFRLEGVSYHASEVGGQGLIPLYRFYLPSKGVHFYTASESEKDRVIATLGAIYRFEGIGYYVLGEDWQPAENATRTGTASMMVTGLGLPKLRTYAWRIPAGPAPAGGRPLVLTLHGNGGTQDIPAQLSRWTDEEGAVVVGLQGLAPGSGASNWEFRMDGRYAAAVPGTPPPQGADDIQFISDLIDRVLAGSLGESVNPAKVFVVGYSRGAGMAFSAYADPRTRNKIAAIAPVSGTFYCDMATASNGVLAALPADADPNCGALGDGWYAPRADLFARQKPMRILGIWGKTANGELAYTQLENDLDNPYGSLGLWAA